MTDDSLYCEICDVAFQQTRAFLAHCNSVLHNQKRAKLEEQSSGEIARPEEENADERARLEKSKVIQESSKPDKESELSAFLESSEYTISEKSADEASVSELSEPAAKKKKKEKVKEYKETNFDVYTCQVCDITCTGRDTYISHCGGRQHCKKYLVKQNEMGFRAFRREYGDPLYDRDDEKEPPPEVKDDYLIHVYRSGVFNKLFCRACGQRMFTFKAWYDHMLGEEHGKKMVDLVQLRGGSRFMTMFGDLPGPNPRMSNFNDQSDSHRRKVAGNSKSIASRGSSATYDSYRKGEFCQPSSISRDRRGIAMSQRGLERDQPHLPTRFSDDYDAVDHCLRSDSECYDWSHGQNSMPVGSREYVERQGESRCSEYRAPHPAPNQLGHGRNNFRLGADRFEESDVSSYFPNTEQVVNPCRPHSGVRPGPVSFWNQNTGHVICDEATSGSNFSQRGGFQTFRDSRLPSSLNPNYNVAADTSYRMPRMPTRLGR